MDHLDDPLNAGWDAVIRHEPTPLDSFVFEPDKNWRYVTAFDPSLRPGLRIYNGALDALSPDVVSRSIFESGQLRFLGPGPHTISNLGDETVDFYFLVVEDAPDADTPAP